MYSKYKNKRTKIDGIVFDSKKEAERYVELKLLERSGVISNLQRQVCFEIVPKTSKNKRARFYVADFLYEVNGRKIIEDVKSIITKKNPVYSLKKAIVLWRYPEFDFREF